MGPKPSNFETDWYICVQCGNRGYANVRDFLKIVLKKNKICIDCIAINNKASQKKYAAKTKKKKAEAVPSTCKICGDKFIRDGNRKTCSDLCGSLLREQTMFRREVENANDSPKIREV